MRLQATAPRSAGTFELLPLSFLGGLLYLHDLSKPPGLFVLPSLQVRAS